MSIADYFRNADPRFRRVADAMDAGGIIHAGVIVGTNDYVATLRIPVTDLLDGTLISARPENTNTGAATFGISNEFDSKPIKRKNGSTALSAGDMVSGIPCLLLWDSTAEVWRLLSFA